MNNYVIISGSTRTSSQSSKVSEYLINVLLDTDENGQATIVDLSEVDLPNWHEGFWQDEIPSPQWAAVSAALAESDGFIIVSPEWNGMVPPPLMNLFLLANRREFAHKPALIVSVSAGAGGAYPVAELRTYGPKNTQICYIPDHVVIRDATNVLNEDEPESDADTYIRERIAYSIRMLIVYTQAFIPIRRSGAIDLESFPYGM